MPARHQAATVAELELLWRWWRCGGIAHVLYAENHGPLFGRWPEAPRALVATLHLPPARWSKEALAQLPHLRSAIVLSQRDMDFFEARIGRGRVRFIPHGVDTVFFMPADRPAAPERLVFGGVYLRNTAMLARIIAKLHSMRPNLKFDLLVPEQGRSDAHLRTLAGHPAVTWHAGLNDEALLALYRKSYLALLPMNSSSANNAILEALACGLPIVTTDVGGIRDYGGDSVFPIVANDDDDAMIALIEQYLDRPGWRDEIARGARMFAETHLAWPIVARAHIDAYRELSEESAR
jgi:glycosyltransferase involved in cell wall biosynthesis